MLRNPAQCANAKEAADLAGLLEREGYAILPEVVGPEDVSELINAVQANGRAGEGLERGGSVYAMRNLLRAVPAIRWLAESEALLGPARVVLGPDAFVVRGLWFDKSIQANWGVPWHQDLTIAVKRRVVASGYGPWTVKGGVPHVQPPASVLERMLTLRLHLDESDVSGGPLRVIPGSHVEGRLDLETTRLWLKRVGPSTCLVPRGGLLAMRPLILHASSPAEVPTRRRVVHLEYAADPLPGGAEWFESTVP